MRKLQLLVCFLFAQSCIFGQSTTLFPYIDINVDRDLYGYCDSNGKVVIEPAYKYAEPFTNGCGIVRFSASNGKSGNPFDLKSIFLDAKGKLAIKDTFDYAHEFIKKLVEVQPGIYKETFIARVKKGDENFYIDRSGKRIQGQINTIQPGPSSYKEGNVEFPYEMSYEGGKRLVKYGGKVVLGPIGDYISVQDIEKGIFLVTDDEKGKAVIKTGNNGPIKWYNDVVFVAKTLGKDKVYSYFFTVADTAETETLIDEDGQVLLSGAYRYIREFDKANSILEVVAKGDSESWPLKGLYNLNTRTFIEPKYQTLRLTKYNNIFHVFIHDKSLNRDRWFYINSRGVEFTKK